MQICKFALTSCTLEYTLQIVGHAGRPCHSLRSLNLGLEDAESGMTWLLLPEACRDTEHAKVYPLPTKMVDLQRLVAIPVPNMNSGPVNDGDSATKIYLERASLNLKTRRKRRDSAYLDLTRRKQSIAEMQSRVKAQMKQAVEGVKAQAQEAI